MKTLLLFLFIGAVVVSQTEAACGGCFTNHPQQHYCKSDFAVRIEAIESFDYTPQEKITRALVVDGMKLGSRKTGQEIEIYSSTYFCGTNFKAGTEYVITGSKRERDGSKYLYHGACDFAMEWDDLSPQQQNGFMKKYARYCDCPIQGVKSELNRRVTEMEGGSGYEGAHAYWTPYRNCYYNPVKTERLQRDDCEAEYSFCRKNANSECSWQMTTDYVECFEDREQYVMALEGSPGMTDIEQCQILSTRRQRKKCRNAFLKNQASSQAEVVIPLE